MTIQVLKPDSDFQKRVEAVMNFMQEQEVSIEFMGSNTIAVDTKNRREYYLADAESSDENITSLPYSYCFKLIVPY